MKMVRFLSFVCTALAASLLLAANLYASPMAYGLAAAPHDGGWNMMDSRRPNPEWRNMIARPLEIPEGAILIALTFDDGPSEHTPRLLDELRMRGAFATFFTSGNMIAGRQNVAARIVEEGHEIACHAHSHPFLTGLDAAGIRRELTNSRNAIYSATGTKPAVFRPPYGDQNSTVRSVAAEFDMPVILWSIDTLDWRDRNVQTILSRIVDSHGNPLVQDGDIILMHDTLATTVDAAIEIVDILQEQGFFFVTVSQLFEARGTQLVPGGLYRSAR